jgi:hypothetical protein
MKYTDPPMKRKRGISMPNYTQIPNVVLGQMVRMKVPEFYVLLFLCRETFGFHRRRAVASAERISARTGICRRSVIYALHSLEGAGYIERRPVGRTYSYSVRVSHGPLSVSEEAECT